MRQGCLDEIRVEGALGSNESSANRLASEGVRLNKRELLFGEARKLPHQFSV